MNYTEIPYKVIYHVFTDNHDEYYGDYAEAKAIYDEYVVAKENVRLYSDTYWEEKDYEETMIGHEEYLEGHGDYPQ